MSSGEYPCLCLTADLGYTSHGREVALEKVGRHYDTRTAPAVLVRVLCNASGTRGAVGGMVAGQARLRRILTYSMAQHCFSRSSSLFERLSPGCGGARSRNAGSSWLVVCHPSFWARIQPYYASPQVTPCPLRGVDCVS